MKFTCTDGEVIELSADMSGVATGFGMIDNPYFHGDIHWRWKDGDTVIECDESHPMAMPVADAYQELNRRWLVEREQWAYEQQMWDALYDEECRERHEEALWSPMEELYKIQDRLCL